MVQGAGTKRTQLYGGIDSELMGSMLDCTAMALPLTAQQLTLQTEVYKRAKMDGYDLQGEMETASVLFSRIVLRDW